MALRIADENEASKKSPAQSCCLVADGVAVTRARSCDRFEGGVETAASLRTASEPAPVARDTAISEIVLSTVFPSHPYIRMFVRVRTIHASGHSGDVHRAARGEKRLNGSPFIYLSHRGL